MKFKDVFKQERQRKGLTQAEMSKLTGLTVSAISMYENGKREPNYETLELIADFFNVDLNYLLGKTSKSTHLSDISNIVPIAKKKIPLIGTIAAGQPITADEHIEMLLPCVEQVHADFALRVEGDSMIGAGIYDGDIVFIRQQPDVENGQIAAVLIDDSATLKHVYKTPNSCTLVSENPKFPPMVFNESNCDTLRILGLAVAKYSRIKQ